MKLWGQTGILSEFCWYFRNHKEGEEKTKKKSLPSKHSSTTCLEAPLCLSLVSPVSGQAQALINSFLL
ncbi:hypothetical protein XELAEV_18044656mg [Xenopus laevis]|uniref:Uncharacterized protein n=1 Tax=Xenopus laevis TaxID=8355 RepID=A0A974H3Z6_XENLA|nr:hypothetical protein XELAEV_18044656mg [Xenopus laevis]